VRISTAATPARQQRIRWLQRLARSPKGRVLLTLLGLAALAAPSEGLDRVVPAIIAATLTAALLDVALTRLRRQTWIVR
jgi:hypothetical protein